MVKPINDISQIVHFIRNQHVMLDSDLAKMYGIEVKNLNKAVKRNIEKFPSEFMFQLNEEEYFRLRFQIGTSNPEPYENTRKIGRGGRRYMPYAFTEHGVIMLASVLNSPIAIKMNIAIVKTFINMRNYINDPNKKLADLERVLMLHIDDTGHNFAQQSEIINAIIDKLSNLIEHPRPKRKIGFRTGEQHEN